MELRLVIPGEPAAKGRPRATMQGGFVRNYTPKKTRVREAVAAEIAYTQMAGRNPLSGPLRMEVDATMSVPRSWSKKKQAAALAGEILPAKKPDLTNIWKLVEDGLNTIAFLDDSQICEGRMVKRYGSVPQTIVTLTELQPALGGLLP